MEINFIQNQTINLLLTPYDLTDTPVGLVKSRPTQVAII